jgi:hypothetical protein
MCSYPGSTWLVVEALAHLKAHGPSWGVLALRLVAAADEPAMREIMNRAIAELLKPYLPGEAVAASFEIMGLDSQLIADGAYFVITDNNRIVGCGGWSRSRRTLRQR